MLEESLKTTSPRKAFFANKTRVAWLPECVFCPNLGVIGWFTLQNDWNRKVRVNGLLDNDTKTIRRPREGRGVFNTISEARQHHPEKVKGNKEYKRSLQIIREMQRGSYRWKSDGLSDLTYRILGYENASSLRTFVSCHHLRVVPEHFHNISY